MGLCSHSQQQHCRVACGLCYIMRGPSAVVVQAQVSRIPKATYYATALCYAGVEVHAKARPLPCKHEGEIIWWSQTSPYRRAAGQA